MVGVGSGTTDLRDATLRRALNAPGSRTPEPTWMPNGRTVASAVTVRVAAVDLKSDTAVPLFTVGHSLGEHAFGLLLWNVLGALVPIPALLLRRSDHAADRGAIRAGHHAAEGRVPHLCTRTTWPPLVGCPRLVGPTPPR